MRKIIHVDMDAFYASVEQRDRPELRGRPVVVGGNPESRGVVCSASYEARRFGIRSAMASRMAARLCPQAVFVRPDFSKYKEASRRIREIFYDVTDLVEPLSLDEAYLDVTQNKLNEVSATRIAQGIRKRIQDELGLTASAGVAPNKFLSKIASDLNKPNGLFVIPPERVNAFVEKLPVEKLWGVGPATAKRLNALGIFTTEDLRKRPKAVLIKEVGSFGGFLHSLAFGEDPREVHPHREPKSSGSETTFENDIQDLAVLSETIRELSDDVARSLIRIARRGQTITLKLRYADFKTITRSRTLPRPCADVETISATACDLMNTATDAGRRPVRLVGVTMSHLVDESHPEQLLLTL
jgi:DNA polymerase-4